MIADPYPNAIHNGVPGFNSLDHFFASANFNIIRTLCDALEHDGVKLLPAFLRPIVDALKRRFGSDHCLSSIDLSYRKSFSILRYFGIKFY